MLGFGGLALTRTLARQSSPPPAPVSLAPRCANITHFPCSASEARAWKATVAIRRAQCRPRIPPGDQGPCPHTTQGSGRARRAMGTQAEKHGSRYTPPQIASRQGPQQGPHMCCMPAQHTHDVQTRRIQSTKRCTSGCYQRPNPALQKDTKALEQTLH